MALTDSDAFHAANAVSRQTAPARRPYAALPGAALSRLPQLHAETVQAARLNNFLGHAIQAAWLLMLSGAAALALGGGRSLPEDFAWSLLILFGVLAMLRTYMRAFAIRRGPVETLASDLRAATLYAGFAWGAGAFLVLPSGAGALALAAFAAPPSLLMAAILRDRGATILFAAPVAAMCASAALLDVAGGLPGAVAVILAQSAVMAAAILLTQKGARSLPPGFALR